MGDEQSARIKALMEELRKTAEQDGYELFIFAEKQGKYRYMIDMDLPALGIVRKVVKKYYDRVKMMDLMKN